MLQLTARQPNALLAKMRRLRNSALDKSPISGLTHRFYRYPARFSPSFAHQAIVEFSNPGDVVLDPYMGGGTTIVEAVASGRCGIGADLNELAVFVARVKTTVLTSEQRSAIAHWADTVVPNLSYWGQHERLGEVICARRTFNLTLPIARPIKKFLGLALCQLDALPDVSAQAFVRCSLLNTAQWALNGRKQTTTLSDFRDRVRATLHEMLVSELHFSDIAQDKPTPHFLQCNSADISTLLPENSVDMVVTSPPYPGIHMLYHRWQVDGRRETPAPYWIAGCHDGKGASYYNFADRRTGASDSYFTESLRTLRGIRKVMKPGAAFVQMIAFSDPELQLPRYLDNMARASFAELRLDVELGFRRHRRIWRNVPSRRWHANFKGNLNAANEVVLIHRAV